MDQLKRIIPQKKELQIEEFYTAIPREKIETKRNIFWSPTPGINRISFLLKQRLCFTSLNVIASLVK